MRAAYIGYLTLGDVDDALHGRRGADPILLCLERAIEEMGDLGRRKAIWSHRRLVVAKSAKSITARNARYRLDAAGVDLLDAWHSGGPEELRRRVGPRLLTPVQVTRDHEWADHADTSER